VARLFRAVCLPGLDFGPCPLVLFLSVSWVLSFYKVWQDFITSFQGQRRKTRSKQYFSQYFCIGCTCELLVSSFMKTVDSYGFFFEMIRIDGSLILVSFNKSKLVVGSLILK